MTAAPLGDLESLIARLGDLDRIVRVTSEVDLRFDLVGIAHHFAGTPRAAVLFENVKGHAAPVLAGVYSRREIVAAAIGVDQRGLSPWLAARLDGAAAFEPVTAAAGPVLDVTESAVDLGRLPVPVHALDDAGPSIYAAVVIAKDPATGTRSLSMPRLDVTGRETLRVALDKLAPIAAFLAKARRLDRSLWVTVNCGVGPALQLAAMAGAGMTESDHLAKAGAFAGERVELVQGRESDSEMVAKAMWSLECEVAPDDASGGSASAHVRRMHRRAAPVFHTVLPGDERAALAGISVEARVLALLDRQVPGIRGVHVAIGGGRACRAIVALAAEHRAWAKQAIVAAFAAHPDLRFVTVVEESVDISDADAVERALTARFDARIRLVRIDDEASTKLGFDATGAVTETPPTFKSVAISHLKIEKRVKRTPEPPRPESAREVPATCPIANEPSPDYDPERIWRRQMDEWGRVAAERAAAAAASTLKPESGSDWDEDRWWRREMDEMREEREEQAKKQARRAAAKARETVAPVARPSAPAPSGPEKDKIYRG